MRGALRKLLDRCEHTDADLPCPIIDALAGHLDD
jgi:hypothetical protein